MVFTFPHQLASRYHGALPERIRIYLNSRGIADAVIDLHLLGWNGNRITIPIFDREGHLAFFKLAKDPEDTGPSPKMVTTPGAHAELYGWERVNAKPCRIVICEGEFDRLVLESNGFAAVTSTGGASVFRPEWAEAFRETAEVHVCFDRDKAGRAGARRVCELIPRARIVELPEEVDEGGDVTDFFARLSKSAGDFEELLAAAKPLVGAKRIPPPATLPRPERGNDGEIATIKSATRLEGVVGQYMPLRQVGQTFVGSCPFHNEEHPSFTVYPADQHFHCFGCQAHGDVIDFLMRIEKVAFREALRHLKRAA